MNKKRIENSLLLIVYILFIFLYLPNVFAQQEIVLNYTITTNNFIENASIVLESYANQSIIIDYSNSTFITGLTALLGQGTQTATQFNIAVINVSDGVYHDRIAVNNSLNSTTYHFYFNVTAGWFNESLGKFVYIVSKADLPWSRVQRVTLNAPPGSNITVFYQEWMTGEQQFIVGNEGTYDLFVNLTIPVGVSAGEHIKTLSFSRQGGTLQSIDFRFHLLEVIAQCAALRPNFEQEDIDAIFKQFLAYKTCLDENRPVETINTTSVIPIPGDLNQWLSAYTKALQDLVQQKEATIQSQSSNLQNIQIELQQEKDRLANLEQQIVSLNQQFNATIMQLDTQKVGKGWKTAFLWSILIIGGGFFAWRKIDELI